MHDIDWKQKQENRREVKDHVRRFLLFPTFWKDSNCWLPRDLKWEKVKFQENNAHMVPNSNGIYCFVVTPPKVIGLFDTQYLFYIGKASSAKLRARYKNYIKEKNGVGIGKQPPRIKIQEMLNIYFDHIYFYYLVENDSKKVIEYEDKLLDVFMPYVNTLIPRAQIKEEYKHIY